MPAFVLAALLIGLVAVTRLPVTPQPPAPTSRAALATSTPQPSIARSVPAPRVTPSAPPPGLPADSTHVLDSTGKRFVDGIPAQLRGEHVIRVADLATATIGTHALVGGWYEPPDCGPVQRGFWCPAGVLTDVPGGSSRTEALPLDSGLGKRPGPRIVRVTVRSNDPCLFAGRSHCPPLLTVERVLWRGDATTLSRPLDPVSVFAALAARFPDVDFAPLKADITCPDVPAHAYQAEWSRGAAATTAQLPVSLVVIFPSTASRRAHGAATGDGCPSLMRAVGFDSTWVAAGNVVVLMGSSTAVSTVAEALSAARGP